MIDKPPTTDEPGQIASAAQQTPGQVLGEYRFDRTLEHRMEIRKGERFAFGKNWARFLSWVTPQRIELAKNSLRAALQVERLDGKTFLDIGSGSGLFSLAARLLGASVRSFDYDPRSVACTHELRRRYFPDDSNWVVEHGSVLDHAYLRSLGTYDVVYSWGVLHHTGAMWQALENVKQLVRLGGQLYVAIYNDQGAITDRWARTKRIYNMLPRPLAFLYALGVIARSEAKELLRHYRDATTRDWLRNWTDYDTISTRGMSRWYDWIDWIGGHPYERATIDQIIDAYAEDGFRLTKLVNRDTSASCNEFVFRREAPDGTFVEASLPGGRSMARRFGRRVTGPFARTDRGWTGSVRAVATVPVGCAFYLVRNDTLIGTAVFTDPNQVLVAPALAELTEVEAVRCYVVTARIHLLMPPFHHMRGRMWEQPTPDLVALADYEGDGNDTRSCVFLFEDGRQLPYPHALHDDIDQYGDGRFSHWRASILFSTTDGSDPNRNGRRYELVVAQAE